MRMLATEFGGGKTTACVEWLREDPENRVIVTPNSKQAIQIQIDHHLSGRQVVAIWQVVEHPALVTRKAVAIDELDACLRILVGDVELVTQSLVREPQR